MVIFHSYVSLPEGTMDVYQERFEKNFSTEALGPDGPDPWPSSPRELTDMAGELENQPFWYSYEW